MLQGTADDVPVATRLVPDERARHFWDDAGTVMRGFTAALSLPETAWDVFLLYGPEARWDGDLPPAPDFWMHQLGSKTSPRVNGPFLDPGRFAQAANVLLGRR